MDGGWLCEALSSNRSDSASSNLSTLAVYSRITCDTKRKNTQIGCKLNLSVYSRKKQRIRKEETIEIWFSSLRTWMR